VFDLFWVLRQTHLNEVFQVFVFVLECVYIPFRSNILPMRNLKRGQQPQKCHKIRANTCCDCRNWNILMLLSLMTI